MSTSTSGVASVVGMMLGSWLLPGSNIAINTLIGLLIGTALDYAFNTLAGWFLNSWLYRAIRRYMYYRYQLSVVCSHPDDRRYVGISKYLFDNCRRDMSACSMVYDWKTDVNELSLLRESSVFKPIVVAFEQHTILIKITRYRCNGIAEGTIGSDYSPESMPSFDFFSQTADLDVLRRYVTNICAESRLKTMDMTKHAKAGAGACRYTIVHSANVEFDDKQAAAASTKTAAVAATMKSCAWKTMYYECSKTIANTQVHRDVNRDFFDDIDRFIENRAWYDERGLVHQRGYFLHSPPGCGKTAMLKALAKSHDLEIFTVDLSVVRTSVALTTLANTMREQMYDSKNTYMLAFEDIDRCEALLDVNKSSDTSDSDSDSDAASAKSNGISMTTLLNVLDGLCSPTSRIIVMTANDSTIVERHRALVRPGRVDKTIAIPYVDDDQLQRMMRVYYPGFDVESLFRMRSDSAQQLADRVFTDITDDDSDDSDGATPCDAQYRLSVESELLSTMVVARIQQNLDTPLRALEALTRIVA